MATNLIHSSNADISQELVHHIAATPIEAGDKAVVFLENLDWQALFTDSQAVVEHAEFILEIHAAIKLLIWEHRGIRVHLEMGLPTGHDAMLEVFRAISKYADTGRRALDVPLFRGVLALFHEHFAWEAPRYLGTDLLLGDADSDILVETLAKFLWAHRAEFQDLDMAPRN